MSNTLRIIGICELPTPLEMGVDYIVAGKLSIPKIETIDLKIGKFELLHKGKIHSIELADKIGKTFKGTAKGSQSQVMRYKIMDKYGADAYESVMSVLLTNLDEICEKYIR